LSEKPKALADTRKWDNILSLRDGVKVIVRGAQVPGGRVVLFYPATGRTLVAANAGDVRVDVQNDLLYVKAHGFAGDISEETWLFEYDLRRQLLVERVQVKNGALPAECPGRS
jgi:hypothetical protein